MSGSHSDICNISTMAKTRVKNESGEKGKKENKPGIKSDSPIRYKAPAVSDTWIAIDAEWLRERIQDLENEQIDDKRDLRARINGRNEVHLDLAKLRKYEKTVAGQKSSRDYRWKKHDELRRAYSNQEDFLYYQNRRHRLQRAGIINDEEGKSPSKAVKGAGLFAYEISTGFARATLDYYDDRRMGLNELWQGSEYSKNCPSKLSKEEVIFGPTDLHLWTPQHRRELVGVGIRRHDPDNVRGPAQISLDLSNIEKRRDEIECRPSQACTEGTMPSYNNHSERRENQRIYAFEKAQEVLKIKKKSNRSRLHCSLRPTTSQMRLEKKGKVITHKERFNEIQEETGLFIAAKESSFDWLTSYDCLGSVEHGYTVDVHSEGSLRDVRIIAPDSGGDSDMGGDGMNKDTITKNTEVTNLVSSSKEPLVQTRKSKRGRKNEEISDDVKRKRTASMEVGYGYAYEENEFTQPKKRKERSYERKITSCWYEATDGRREWHIGQIVPDSSPPASPPRMNLLSTIMESTIPEGIPDLELSAPKRQRCQFNESCRKWWSHTTIEECWQANLEEPLYLGNKDEDPIPLPVSSFNGEDCLLPIASSGRETYRSRLEDHYGRLRNGALNWPKFGVRVPYAPFTIMDDVVRSISGTSSKREFPVTRSMAIPLIDRSQRGWALPDIDFQSEKVVKRGVDEESDSDDDGDLFLNSYLSSP